MTKRDYSLGLMVGGFAAAIVLFRLQSARYFAFAPSWHRFVREGDATVAALLIALCGLYLYLRKAA